MIVEYSRRTCDCKTLVHRLCKTSIRSVQNTTGCYDLEE